MSHCTTAELSTCLERLRAGDPQARAVLIDRSQERLRQLARHQFHGFARLRRFADTGDVLQEAVLRLLQRLNAHVPDTPAEFLAMAAREIRCALLDLIRHYYGPHGPGRREVAPNPADSDDGGSLPVDPAQHMGDPGKLAVWTEFHVQVEQLPVAERCVFELRWYHGMTWRETAAVLNMSEATARRHWLTARLRLRERLTFNLDAL
jgi:RNA polymerase sigma-70 factor (ECF subfamily)